MADQPVPTYDANGKLVKDPWSATWWASLGLPPEVGAQLDKILAGYTNPTAATAAAQTYLRTTKWYAQTFPGIAEGMANGLVTDEVSYRAYMHQINDVYQQQVGRQATAADVSNWLTMGKNADYVGRYIQGQQAYAPGTVAYQQQQALAGAQGPGRLSDRDLAALGEQQAGIASPLGAKIEAQMKQAAQRLQGVFQGVAGNASVSLGPQGPFAQTLQGSQATDVGA